MSLVHYCPGSAPGSPADLTRAEAEGYLAQDTAHIERMEAADSLASPAFWPHIGGTCGRCKQVADRLNRAPRG